MNQKHLIIVFGEANSKQNILYEHLRVENGKRNLVEQIQTRSNDQLYIMSIPHFKSYHEEVLPLQPFIIEFVQQQKYSISQLIFCLNDQEKLHELINRIVETMSAFYSISYSKLFTFFISGLNAKSSQLNDLSNQAVKISNFIFSNENNSFNIQQWYNTNQRNLTSQQIFIQQSAKVGQISPQNSDLASKFLNGWLQELKKKEFTHIGQFLAFVENQKEITFIKKELQNWKFIKTTPISIYKNILEVIVEFQRQFNKRKQEILQKCRENYFLNNSNYCNRCQRFISFNDKRTFFFPEPFTLMGQKWEYGINQINYCKQCSYQFQNYAIEEFLSLSIINKTVSQLYELRQPEYYEQKYLNQEVQLIYPQSDDQFQNKIFESRPNKSQYSQENNVIINQTEQPVLPISENDYIQNNSFLSFDSEEEKTQAINALFLSCENNEKSFIFTKLMYPSTQKDYIVQGEFKKSKKLCNLFCVIDSPSFQFIEDPEKTTTVFKNYFSKNTLHFLFLFVDFQRTDLMKERINQMVKKLIRVNKKQIAIVITNWAPNQQDSENEIKEFARNIRIEKTIFISSRESPENTKDFFKKCLEDVEATPLSFAATVFAPDTEEELIHQKEIEENLNSITRKIATDQKLQVTQEIQKSQEKIESIQCLISELEQKVYSLRRQLNDEEKNRTDLKNKLVKIQKDEQQLIKQNNKQQPLKVEFENNNSDNSNQESQKKNNAQKKQKKNK